MKTFSGENKPEQRKMQWMFFKGVAAFYKLVEEAISHTKNVFT